MNKRRPDMPDQLAYKVTPTSFKVKAAQPDDNPDVLMRIAGYASTNDVDEYNEVVLPSAFAGAMPAFMEFPIMLFGHRWSDKPIGKWDSYHIDDRGLWMEGSILNTAEGKDIATLINSGILKALSIGFNPIDTEAPEEDGDPKTITALSLWEVSVVNVPANRGALFDQVKQYGIELKSLDFAPRAGGSNTRSNTMSKEIEAQIEKLATLPDALDEATSRIGDLEANYKKAVGMVTAIQEKYAEVQKGTVPLAEYEQLKESVTADIIAVNNSLNDAKKALTTAAESRPTPADLITNAAPFERFTTDSGKALPAGQARLRALLMTPVHMDGTPDGEILKSFRNASDTLLFEHAYMQGRSPRQVSPKDCQAWPVYERLLDLVDPQFKAMYSTGSDLGDEWVPTVMTAQLYDEVRKEAVVKPLFGTFDMPSNPATYPVATSLPTVYVAAEATSNNPDNYLSSTWGTGSVTFSAHKLACAVRMSDEFEQDSILDVAPIASNRIARAVAKAEDSVILNGDTTSTHRDTGAGYTSASPETICMGLRMTAIDRSATDATAAGGTVDASDFRAGRATMSLGYATDPREIVYITTISPYFDLMADATQTQGGTYLANASYRDGKINEFDGSPIYITDQMTETMASTGLYTSGSLGGALIVNTTAFRVGVRKGMTIEYTRDPWTGQFAFIASLRMDFQCMAETTTVKPLCYMINLA